MHDRQKAKCLLFFRHDKSLYFRNVLVRANYNNFSKGIYAKTDYLERFFENLLIGTQHRLSNKNLHIDVPKVQNVQNDTLKLTPKELAVYNAVTVNPEATQKEIAELTKVSLITVKRVTIAL